MHRNEFIILLFWLLGPPILVGVALLKVFPAKTVSLLDRRFWIAVIILVVVAILIELAFVALDVLTPRIQGLHLGARDIEIFGFHTMWAPLGFVCVAMAFPFAAWWLGRKKARRSDEPQALSDV